MNLITMLKTGEATYSGAVSLDSLHDAATRLGEVKLDHDLGKGQYVQIYFKNRSGSMIWAKGYSSDIREAYQKAIAEAISLGASR